MNGRKKLKTKNNADLPITIVYAISNGLARAIEAAFVLPKEVIKLTNKDKSTVINIEICKSPRTEGTWDARIGDIEGSIDVYNMDKKMILELISEEME